MPRSCEGHPRDAQTVRADVAASELGEITVKNGAVAGKFEIESRPPLAQTRGGRGWITAW
jgi:hypothetical protein